MSLIKEGKKIRQGDWLETDMMGPHLPSMQKLRYMQSKPALPKSNSQLSINQFKSGFEGERESYDYHEKNEQKKERER